MGADSKLKVPNGEGSSSPSSRQGRLRLSLHRLLHDAYERINLEGESYRLRKPVQAILMADEGFFAAVGGLSEGIVFFD